MTNVTVTNWDIESFDIHSSFVLRHWSFGRDDPARPIRLLPLDGRVDRHDLRHRRYAPVAVAVGRLPVGAGEVSRDHPPVPGDPRPAAAVQDVLGRRADLRAAGRGVLYSLV